MAGGVRHSSFGCLPLLFLSGAVFAADALPSFEVNAVRTSVSGLSSGAYMAGQFHVAFSGTLIGVGIVAGGPYGCAEGELPVALNRCMETGLGVPDPARLLERAQASAAEGDIDPLANLADDRVYVFSGTEDETVTPSVVAEVVAFYRLAGLPEEAVQFVGDLEAGHGFITEDRGNACDVTRSPFVNDCDYDQAGAILEHMPCAVGSGTNRLIVLYPQATATPANPNACWDWWGYDDPRYATRSGRQMAAVRAMLARLAGDTVAPDLFCQVHSGDQCRPLAGRSRQDLQLVVLLCRRLRRDPRLCVQYQKAFREPAGQFRHRAVCRELKPGSPTSA